MFCIFHDIIYDPKSKTNELDSMEVYTEFLKIITKLENSDNEKWTNIDTEVRHFY